MKQADFDEGNGMGTLGRLTVFTVMYDHCLIAYKLCCEYRQL